MAGAPPDSDSSSFMSQLTALHALFADGHEANHPVCHDGKRFVLWQEFAHRIQEHAAGFNARHELRWLLSSEQPMEFAILLFALLHAGKEVIIPPNTQPGTLEQLADTFEARAAAEIIGNPVQLKAFDPTTAIIDLYTSGSSGDPKRVRKTLAQFENEIDTLEGLWGSQLGPAAIVATAPHSHFYGLLFRLLWPLASGRVFDNLTCTHPDTLQERFTLLRDCALVSSPAQLGRLPELLPLASLQPSPRIIFSSGGPLSATSASEFQRQLGCAPTEVFGSTETGGIAWRRQETDAFWTPFPGLRVFADEDGALLLHSPFLATEESRENYFYRMDDAIELQTDGRFSMRGRLDRTVKIEEKRLSLPELEARLAEHPWVSATAATMLTGRRQYIGAAVVLNSDGQTHLTRRGRRAIAQAFRHHLSKHFEAVLLPRRWRFPGQLPINERGKLTQTALAALFTSPAEENENSPA
jgi:acyl-coenzyme A synthetase/AMP-(fatty) acid ligase